jgi:hypothetical protein
MKATASILILFFTMRFAGMAQSDSIKPRFMKLYAVSLNGGVYAFTDYKLHREELQALNPDNQLLKKDISKYKYMGNNKDYSGTCVNANAAFILYNKHQQAYNRKQELRFGLSYQTNEKLEYEYLLEERIPFDTLKSNTNPKVYYIDNTKTSHYYYSIYRKNILVNVTHTFHTKQNRIWSAYIGYSLGYGRIISNITTAEYFYTEGFEDQNHKSYDYTTAGKPSIGESERSVKSGGNSIQAAIPIGGLLRLSKTKKNYMKRVALNIETKTGIRFTQIPQSSSMPQFFFNANIGLKFYLTREAIH